MKMKVMQLDLFDDFMPVPTLVLDNGKIIRELKSEVEKLNESNNRVRKSLFARHGELSKMYIEMHNRLEILERNICKGK
jgi:hypothetical protein